MSESLREFLKIAKVEIEELRDNILVRLDMHEKRKDAPGVTEHVYLENRALLLNEICCLQRFLECLDETAPSTFRSIEEALREILERFRAEVKSCGYAPCALLFAERRLHKAAKYAADDDSEG